MRGIAAGTDFRSVTELEELGANLVLAGGDFGLLVRGWTITWTTRSRSSDRRAEHRPLETEQICATLQSP